MLASNFLPPCLPAKPREHRAARIWLSLACAASLASCDKSKPASSSEKSNTSGPVGSKVGASGDSTQSAADLNAVLATVEGVQITVREFQKRINRQSPYIRARYTTNKQKREFLENLVRFEVLAQEAKAEGFDTNIDVVRAMKQAMVQKLMTKRFQKGIQPSDVTEEAMRTYYDAHPEEYNKPAEVRVSAVILDSEAKAEEVETLARNSENTSNAGFRELVMRYSVDSASKLRGGDLRYFDENATEPPTAVVAAAFALTKTGDVAGPIKTDGGTYYVIKKTAHRNAIAKSFEQVKRRIQNHLYRDMRTKAQETFVATLRQKASIQIFEDKLSAVKVRPAPAEGREAHPRHRPGPSPALTLPAPASQPLPNQPASQPPGTASPETH